jgi:hypothetical protein
MDSSERLNEITAMAPIRELAERLARKMQRLNHGRQFMSAHMRRGDCEYFIVPLSLSVYSSARHVSHDPRFVFFQSLSLVGHRKVR